MARVSSSWLRPSSLVPVYQLLQQKGIAPSINDSKASSVAVYNRGREWENRCELTSSWSQSWVCFYIIRLIARYRKDRSSLHQNGMALPFCNSQSCTSPFATRATLRSPPALAFPIQILPEVVPFDCPPLPEILTRQEEIDMGQMMRFNPTHFGWIDCGAFLPHTRRA